MPASYPCRRHARSGTPLAVLSRLFLALCALASLAIPHPALSQETEMRDVTDPVEAVSKPKDGLDYVLLPVPIVNPAVGTGLGSAAALLYKLDADSPASATVVGAFYTDSHSWGLGAAQKAYFDNDRYHITALAFYYHLNYDFFGIGADAGSRGKSVPLTQAGYAVIPEALARVVPNAFLGLRYRYLVSNTSGDVSSTGGVTGVTLPRNQLRITSAGLGPVAEHDSRDDRYFPTAGFYARLEASFSDRVLLSNTKSYQTYAAAYNGYAGISENTVLAYRASLCAVSASTPFFDLCSYGLKSDLRGYTPGQYRDKTSFAVQAEYRWRFLERFSVNFFGGVGGVAPDWGKYEFDKLLPGGGIGLRYLASKENKLNVGMDFAVGKRSHALYFRIGEAF